DEPTGNLDRQAGTEIMDILCRLHRAGKTVVLITHDPAVARLAPRLFRMEAGRLQDLTGGQTGC
ncbi:MAG: macrolide ABC transporter ATP-binding protein, partial [Clostridia bacterium]|nr:macrolide ABC transporter ATP-binding protein [Clostridia bacterium]